VPLADALTAAVDPDEAWELGVSFGEDFELVCTLPSDAVDGATAAVAERGTTLTVVGRVVDADAGVTVDGDPLPDRGYTHGAE
jgi:thiamine-monophosphate kinase